MPHLGVAKDLTELSRPKASPLQLLMDHHTLLLAHLPLVPWQNCPFFIFLKEAAVNLHESFPDTALKRYPQCRASAFSCNCLLLQHMEEKDEDLQGCLYLISVQCRTSLAMAHQRGCWAPGFPEPTLIFQCSTAPSREPPGWGWPVSSHVLYLMEESRHIKQQ